MTDNATNNSATPPAPQDERVRALPWYRRLLARPESAAVSGAILVFVIFAIEAGGSGMFAPDGIVNWMTVSAYIGIVAVGAALLMVGGEFDLSVGSMIGFAGMAMVIPPLYWGWPVWLSAFAALGLSTMLGWFNGFIVVRTGLPSFIVTLASFYVLRGLALVMAVHFTGQTIISQHEELVLSDLVSADPVVAFLFKGHTLTGMFDYLAQRGLISVRDDGHALAIGVPKVVVWWLMLAAVGSFVLSRTPFGNAIQICGGDKVAAKNVGINVMRTKLILFSAVAFCAALFAVLQVCDAGSAAADRGLQKEFEAIIAAVIGGCLLTGGYGSILGASVGALIFGVVQIGIGYTNLDNNWYRVFLGLMLLVAVIFNNFIRRKVAFSR